MWDWATCFGPIELEACNPVSYIPFLITGRTVPSFTMINGHSHVYLTSHLSDHREDVDYTISFWDRSFRGCDNGWCHRLRYLRYKSLGNSIECVWCWVNIGNQAQSMYSHLHLNEY